MLALTPVTPLQCCCHCTVVFIIIPAAALHCTHTPKLWMWIAHKHEKNNKNKYNNTDQEERREEKGLWACADLMPHSYPTARIASEIAIHTWDCKCKAAECTGKVRLFLCLSVCLSPHEIAIARRVARRTVPQ
jgi:hypothetical protein